MGQVFREADWLSLKALLKSRLQELGYADAAVGGEVYVEITNQTARVNVIADPGPRVKFGSIFVTSGGVNPTCTIQALALYIADSMKQRLATLFD